MGSLINRLLTVLVEEDLNSTNYHIAMTLLENIDIIYTLSIGNVAKLCNVSKSTLSKFCREIGFEDYYEFKDASKFKDNRYDNQFSYNHNVMKFIETHSFDDYMENILTDINLLTYNINQIKIDQLAKDIVAYKHVAAFGLLYSETAAIDLQTKLAYNKKFIFTSINDVKQHEYIVNAQEDTLIIIFSHSGNYLLKYQFMEGNVPKNIFDKTKAKIVVITSNEDLINNPRADYCISYPNVSNTTTHSVLYPIITDYITLRYRYFMNYTNKG